MVTSVRGRRRRKRRVGGGGTLEGKGTGGEERDDEAQRYLAAAWPTTTTTTTITTITQRTRDVPTALDDALKVPAVSAPKLQSPVEARAAQLATIGPESYRQNIRGHLQSLRFPPRFSGKYSWCRWNVFLGKGLVARQTQHQENTRGGGGERPREMSAGFSGGCVVNTPMAKKAKQELSAPNGTFPL